MPFTGTAEVVESKHWLHEETGRTFSLFTSWCPEGSVLVNAGWTIRWGDGTVGTCKPPFKTEGEAQDYADAWNIKFGHAA
jgi:hypothetical protein